MKYFFRFLTIFSLLTLVGCGTSSTSNDPFQRYLNSVADGLDCPKTSIWCIPAEHWSKAQVIEETIPQKTTVLVGIGLRVPAPLGFKYYNESDRKRARSLKMETYEHPATLILERTASGTRAIINTIEPDYTNEEEMKIVFNLPYDIRNAGILLPNATNTIKLSPSLIAYFQTLSTKPTIPPKPAHIKEGSLIWDLNREDSEQRLRKINDHLWVAITEDGEKSISLFLFSDRYKD